MEGLIVAAVAALTLGVVGATIMFGINYFYRQEATEGDRVKFMDEFDTTKGTIVKDLGNALEVQCMKPNAYGEIVPTIIVVQRSEIFLF